MLTRFIPALAIVLAAFATGCGAVDTTDRPSHGSEAGSGAQNEIGESSDGAPDLSDRDAGPAAEIHRDGSAPDNPSTGNPSAGTEAAASAGVAAGEQSSGTPQGTPRNEPERPGIVPDGWDRIGPGLARASLPPLDRGAGVLFALRLDPALYQLEVEYRAGEPLSIEEWAKTTGADLVVNGGFFDENYRATALVVSRGVATGPSYRGFGGMFSLADGVPMIRSLSTPQQVDELDAAVQSFPMLVTAPGTAADVSDSGLRSRRTAVGIDSQGHVVFVLAPDGSYSLERLAERLAADPVLALDTALNLDGGGSSGLYMREQGYVVPAFDRLPVVITARFK